MNVSENSYLMMGQQLLRLGHIPMNQPEPGCHLTHLYRVDKLWTFHQQRPTGSFCKRSD